jgi:hypothetical protein
MIRALSDLPIPKHASKNGEISAIYSVLFSIFGLFSVALFHVDVFFSIWVSVSILIGVSFFLIRQYRKKRLGLLMLVFWLIYALPFIHIPPYIWFDFGNEPLLLWGLAVNPYMVDERVIQLTAMIGAVGGLGFALGCSFSNKGFQQVNGQYVGGTMPIFRTTAMPVWLAWVGIGVLLTALSAPQETILTAAYTESASALDGANFSSAWMVSYVILSFTFCDALLERGSNAKRIKLMLMMAAILLVVVWYQLLRGDRESISWVFGLALVYYYWAAGVTQRRDFTIPWHKIAATTLALFMVTMVVGVLRSGLVGLTASETVDLIMALYQSDRIGLNNVFTGTWSAVLLTPLSVAGDHIYGLLNLKWGQDYLDLLLSIIPGFLADAIGYVRPLNSNQGPAWEMRYGIGGTHASVVPFMNFSMLGVFLIPTLWSWFFANVEKSTLRRVNVLKLSFLVTFAMAAPHWLWYGEKSAINALVMWIVFSFLYRVSLGISRVRISKMDSSIKRGCANA